MNRTRRRPLPAGRLSPRAALIFGVALAALAVPTLALAANGLTALLGLVAVLIYVLIYTPLKRVTSLALVVGSIPGAFPPLMGWTAVTGRIDPAGLALFTILFIWQIPHFLAIALFLREDYARGGLRVLPLVRGVEATRRHLLAWTIALIPASLLLVPLGVAGTAYLLAAILLGAGFLAVAIRGLSSAEGDRWARQAFGYSLVYLTALVGVLVATVH